MLHGFFSGLGSFMMYRVEVEHIGQGRKLAASSATFPSPVGLSVSAARKKFV
jgi:hypothetical protein